VIYFRRELLERDDPVDFRHVLATIRNLSGWGSSDLAFVLNIPRTTLISIETRGSQPHHHDGQAILKLLDNCRKSVTCEDEITA